MRLTKKLKVFSLFAVACIFCFFFGTDHVKAAQLSGSTSTNREEGVCSYIVEGLDLETDSQITITVNRSDDPKETPVYTWQDDLSAQNVTDGTYKGSVAFSDLNNTPTSYAIHAQTDSGTKVKLGGCDFSVHQSKITLSVSGRVSDAKRTFTMNSAEAADGYLAPGTGNTVSLYVWANGKSESTSVKLSSAKSVQRSSLVWKDIDLSKQGLGYGDWNAKVVMNNTLWPESLTVAKSSFSIQPSCTSFKVIKKESLEKKASFMIEIKGLANVYGTKSVSFQVYNKSKKIYTIKGTKVSDGKYQATVKLSKLNYKLVNYTIKAVITDQNNKTKTLSQTTYADERIRSGIFAVTPKNNATTAFTLKNAYIPGNIKKIKIFYYDKNNKKYKTKKVTYSKKKDQYKAIADNEQKGSFTAKVYGYTAWDQKVLLNTTTYKITKKNLGKQGWCYEKYNGKKYKFYYVNNKKVTDLTKIMKLKKNTKFYIEVNRAANVTTVFAYNKETKQYDIPVKTFTVCCGRDTVTKASAGALTIESSFTPIGNYSICSNGIATKYSVKPMHEPDGTIVYARWTTHIVGNVYFHSIAVGSDSHYALPAYRFNYLGTPRSAGCIRMAVADAKWIYDYCASGSKVTIKVGNAKKPGPLGKIKMPKILQNVGYDPTDPAVPDSRKKKDYKAKKITGYMTKSGKKVGY